MMLGATPHANYTGERAVLAPGSTLILYTDGVTKAMDPEGRLFGLRSLAELAREMAGASAVETVHATLSHVTHFCFPLETPDDLTTLVLRRRGAN